jgi:hypothetical protein
MATGSVRPRSLDVATNPTDVRFTLVCTENLNPNVAMMKPAKDRI